MRKKGPLECCGIQDISAGTMNKTVVLINADLKLKPAPRRSVEDQSRIHRYRRRESVNQFFPGLLVDVRMTGTENSLRMLLKTIKKILWERSRKEKPFSPTKNGAAFQDTWEIFVLILPKISV